MNINRKHFVDYMYDISSNNNYVSDFENNISGIELRQKNYMMYKLLLIILNRF